MTVDAERAGARFEAGVLALVTASVLLAGSAITALAVALPVVVRDLGATPLQATWLLLLPFLVTSILLVPCGRLADVAGARPMFTGGFLLFAAGAVLSALSRSAEHLLAAGLVHSVGAAMVLCNTGAVVGAVFGGPRLGWAMGIYLAGVSMSQVLAPALGGLVADAFGWRWLYWAQLPPAVLCILAGSRLLTGGRGGRGGRRSSDPWGSVLLAVTLGAWLAALSRVQEPAQSGPPAPALAGVGLLSAVALYVVERRVPDPILPMRLLRSRSFLLSNVANMTSMLPRFVSVTAAALYFQAVHLDPARTAGLRVLPLPVGITVGSLVADRLARRWGEVSTGLAAAGAMAAGSLLMAAVTATGAGYGWSLAGLLVLGLGAGAFATVTSTLIIRRAPSGDIGSVNGMRLTLMNCAESVALAGGLAVVTAALAPEDRTRFYGAGIADPAVRDVLAGGFSALFVLTALAALVSGLLLTGARTPDP